MPFATASDGIRLAYEEIGAGPPLLLVPGQSSDRNIWNGLREAFADRYRDMYFWDHGEQANRVVRAFLERHPLPG